MRKALALNNYQNVSFLPRHSKTENCKIYLCLKFGRIYTFEPYDILFKYLFHTFLRNIPLHTRICKCLHLQLVCRSLHCRGRLGKDHLPKKIFIYDESEETLIRTLTSLRTLKESQSATHGKFRLNSELDVTTRQLSLWHIMAIFYWLSWSAKIHLFRYINLCCCKLQLWGSSNCAALSAESEQIL